MAGNEGDFRAGEGKCGFERAFKGRGALGRETGAPDSDPASGSHVYEEGSGEG